MVRISIALSKLLLIALYLLLLIPEEIKAVDKDEDVIQLTESTEKIILDQVMEMLEDSDRSYSIEDVTSEQFSDSFIKYSGTGRPNLGYTSSAYWLRMTIDNQSSTQEWLLEFDTPKINRIVLYSPNKAGGFESKTTGNVIPFKDREINHRNLVFKVPLEENETQTLYIKVTTGSSMQLPLTIWNPFTYDEKSNVAYLMIGSLFGISLVMALYNFFLYFSIGSRSYLYYTLFVLLNTLLYLSEMGLGYQFLWPSYIEWNLRAVVILMCLSNMSVLFFAKSFFEIKKFIPKLDVLFKFLIILNTLPIFWILFSYKWAVEAAIICVALTILIVFYTIFANFKKRYRPTRFFAIAWGVFLTGVSISVLVDAGLIPLTFFTKYAWQFTTAIEVVLFSFALGDRIKLIRTEKKEAKQAAKESQELAIENLHKSDKLKDEFLAVTSHELRTPLHGIIGIAETVREGAAGEISPEIRSHLSMIILSGKRLANLVDDILDISKLNNNALDIQPEPIHLYGITDVVLTICQPLLKDKPIELRNEINVDTPLVSADKNRLQQILYNLMGNAIKYTDTGKVVIYAEQLNEFVRVTVADTGRGISSDQLGEIFKPFHQGDTGLVRESNGTGIGLSITKKLVELLQGEIDVQSTEDVGSEFSFTLPISQKDSYPFQQDVRENILLPLTQPEVKVVKKSNVLSENIGTTILIADDEPINLQVLQNQLTMEGYNVIAVSKGEDVLKEIEKQRIDLIILDVMMPIMSGYEVCKRIRLKYTLTELPILMLTARTRVKDMVTSFRVGANDHLAKPCDKRELFQRVRILIQLVSLNQEQINMNRILEEKVKNRTQELSDVNDELQRANTDLVELVNSRQRLLANIAHELGAPVTLIDGYVQAIQQGLIEATQTRYVEMVDNKIGVLNRLIHDLSDMSKLEAGLIVLDVDAVPVSYWLDDILDDIELEVQQGGRRFIRPESIPDLKEYFCIVDDERFDQVFSNIIRNAIKFTSSEDGEISVSILVKDDNSQVIIKIKDNGIGIESRLLPHIFERYYKAASTNGYGESDGTGLGLAIAKEIIKLHEAQIWAESQENESSVFSISLPIKQKKYTKRGEGIGEGQNSAY